MTIGVDFRDKILNIEGELIRMQIVSICHSQQNLELLPQLLLLKCMTNEMFLFMTIQMIRQSIGIFVYLCCKDEF